MWCYGGEGGLRTVELLEDTVDGAGAAAAGHGDVELVGVRHFGCAGGRVGEYATR